MKFFKRKVIERTNGEPYLIRWNLFECSLFSIKVHRILKSDYDCMHDHPWAFFSIILWGGYVEHRDIKRKVPLTAEEWSGVMFYTGEKADKDFYRISRIYHPGQMLFRKATDRHKLEIHQAATTLVVSLKKVRQWGFWTKTGWVPFFKYDSKNTCE